VRGSRFEATYIAPQKFSKKPKKFTKKISESRKFSKAGSVFRDWKEDGADMARKQFEYDCLFTKINRFIKDPVELKKTYDMLLKYYVPVRDQFFDQIASYSSYPAIDWIDFTNHCNTWSVVDKNLKMADIDRIFIATNVELEEQDANEDRSLCRFEFYEIITRMARTKYMEKGICASME